MVFITELGLKVDKLNWLKWNVYLHELICTTEQLRGELYKSEVLLIISMLSVKKMKNIY